MWVCISYERTFNITLYLVLSSVLFSTQDEKSSLAEKIFCISRKIDLMYDQRMTSIIALWEAKLNDWKVLCWLLKEKCNLSFLASEAKAFLNLMAMTERNLSATWKKRLHSMQSRHFGLSCLISWKKYSETDQSICISALCWRSWI